MYNVKEYDLCVSLGATKAGGLQLAQRGLDGVDLACAWQDGMSADTFLEAAAVLVETQAKENRNGLRKMLERSKRVLAVVVSPEIPFAREGLLRLKARLDAVCPGTAFTVAGLNFGAVSNHLEEAYVDDVALIETKRKMHPYDFAQTSVEWAFLEDVQLPEAVKPRRPGARRSFLAGVRYKLNRLVMAHCKRVLSRLNAR